RVGKYIGLPGASLLPSRADPAQTLVAASYHPYFMKTLNGDRTTPLFPDGHRFVRRQDAPAVYQPSGAVYATRYAVLMDQDRVLGKDNRGVVMGFEASVNIDTEWDFLLAELLLAHGRPPL